MDVQPEAGGEHHEPQREHDDRPQRPVEPLVALGDLPQRDAGVQQAGEVERLPLTVVAEQYDRQRENQEEPEEARGVLPRRVEARSEKLRSSLRAEYPQRPVTTDLSTPHDQGQFSQPRASGAPARLGMGLEWWNGGMGGMGSGHVMC